LHCIEPFAQFIDPAPGMVIDKFQEKVILGTEVRIQRTFRVTSLFSDP
jgi:hypothetical protein